MGLLNKRDSRKKIESLQIVLIKSWKMKDNIKYRRITHCISKENESKMKYEVKKNLDVWHEKERFEFMLTIECET